MLIYKKEREQYPIFKIIDGLNVSEFLKRRAKRAAERMIKENDLWCNPKASSLASFCNWELTEEGYEFWNRLYEEG